MKVWVVMEEFTVDDDGDYHRQLEAVHATEAGAEANLTPEINQPDPCSCSSAIHLQSDHRTRYVVEVEVLP